MAATIETTTEQAPVEALYVPKELWIATIFALVLSYILFSENGAVLTEQWAYAHEFFHDGRHIFGVPCH